MEATANNYFTYKYPANFTLNGDFIEDFAHLSVMSTLLALKYKMNIVSIILRSLYMELRNGKGDQHPPVEGKKEALEDGREIITRLTTYQ